MEQPANCEIPNSTRNRQSACTVPNLLLGTLRASYQEERERFTLIGVKMYRRIKSMYEPSRPHLKSSQFSNGLPGTSIFRCVHIRIINTGIDWNRRCHVWGLRESLYAETPATFAQQYSRKEFRLFSRRPCSFLIFAVFHRHFAIFHSCQNFVVEFGVR